MAAWHRRKMALAAGRVVSSRVRFRLGRTEHLWSVLLSTRCGTLLQPRLECVNCMDRRADAPETDLPHRGWLETFFKGYCLVFQADLSL